MCRRTAEWSREAFDQEAVQKYMMETVRSAASEGKLFPTPGDATTLDVLELEGMQLPRVTCAWLKERHRRMGGVGWQVDEWYDDKCEFRDTGYLKFVPL